MAGYNTNLAAEFYVLSTLHRLGVDANLTLGNKKSVDIAVVRGTGDAITVDVKGLAKATGFPIDNVKPGTPRHYLVFVCYMGKIGDPTAPPRSWIVPSTELEPLIYNAPGGRRLVGAGTLRDNAQCFLEAWKLIT